MMCIFKALDMCKWERYDGVVPNGSSTDTAEHHGPMNAAMTHDLMRPLGGGRPWMLMEQTPSQVNWRGHNVLKRAGQLRLWGRQAGAPGAGGGPVVQERAGQAGGGRSPAGGVAHQGERRDPRGAWCVWR